MRFQSRTAALILTIAVASLGVSHELPATPRPLSLAEVEAIRLAAAYMDGGPTAWIDELAPDSALSALGREAALAEIETLAGPPTGSRWTLQTADRTRPLRAVFAIDFPSGLEEILILDFVGTNGALRLGSLRIAAQSVPADEIRGVSLEATSMEPSAPEAEASGGNASDATDPLGSVAAPPRRGFSMFAALAAGAALLLAVFALLKKKRVLAGVAVAIGVVGVLLAVTLEDSRSEPADSAGAEDRDASASQGGSGEMNLSELLALRRALAVPQPEAIRPAMEALPEEGPLATLGRLWHAQYLLAQQDLEGSAALLVEGEAKAGPETSLLAALLRARLAFLRLQEVEAARAYARATQLAGVNDGLILEAAQAFDLLGFENHAQRYYDQLAEAGTRNADAYYGLAQRAIQNGWTAQAIEHFETGWALEPRERSLVLGNPLLAALLEDYSVRELLQMERADEPDPPCLPSELPPVEFTSAISKRRLGSLLVVELLDGELRVPYGCGLQSSGTVAYDALAWRQRAETLALAEAPALIQAGHANGGIASPSVRRRVEDTAAALARRGRWQELLELTHGIDSNLQSAPIGLIRLRAEALSALDRDDDAQSLLTNLAVVNMKRQRPDPGALYRLADLMTRRGEFEIAIRLVAKADSQMPGEGDWRRVRLIQMERRLANSFHSHRTEHFEIRYPSRRNAFLAERFGEILEAERRRLARWIPLSRGEIHEVSLLPWNAFQSTWSSSVEIAGLFDGKIRLPFAEISRFDPIIVAIITHELTHALIDEYTDGRAPHWLHEGLAQHVQMVQSRINPIPAYAIKRNLLAFPLLESVLGSFASPALVNIAYDEANWSLHYIESRYGTRAIRGLLDSFRAGASTEEAIRRVFGRSLAEFERDLWDWCKNSAPTAWKTEVIDYAKPRGLS